MVKIYKSTERKYALPGRKTRSFLLLITAAAAQPQPDGARLSTRQWNVCSAAYAAQLRPCNRRATAAKTQPQLGKLHPAAKTQLWLDKGVPRLLKPSRSLTASPLRLRGKEMHGKQLPCICYYYFLLLNIISSSATF